jgi:alkylation response protein AidB-like acyl-CoA dehydrogenase
VILDEVRLPTAARLGSPGVVLTALEHAVDCSLAALCAEAVGVIEAVNEMTLRHLNTRRPPGPSSGSFRHMILIATQAKSMSYLATSRCRERNRSERRRILSAARAFVGKAARFVGQQAMQLHGGLGTSAERAVSHYFKRLTMINASCGDRDHRVGAFGDLLRAES